MTHPLRLDLPDGVYIRLSEAAQRQSKTVEDYAIEMLKAAARALQAEKHGTDKDDVALNRANDVGA